MKTFNRPVKLSGSKIVINSITIQVLEYNLDGDVLLCTGTTAPTADSSGYAKGCLFIKTDAADGTKGLYENIGIKTASDFNLIGDIAASEIGLAEGSVLVGNSSTVAAALAAETDRQILIGNGTTVVSVAVSGAISISNAGAVAITLAEGNVLVGNVSGAGVALVAKTDTQVLVGNGTTITSVALSGDVTMANTGAVTIATGAIDLAMLSAGVTPSHVVKFAGTITWSGSGAELGTAVAGVLSTDILVASFLVTPTQAAYIAKIVPTTDTITITLSTANTGNNAQISYVVYRAAA